MKKVNVLHLKEKVFQTALSLLILLAFLSANPVFSQNTVPLRRTVSPQQPMYMIHIDTWNYANPQKIIDLIPADIRPYVVMNISLSISHDVPTSRFKVAEYGYEVAKFMAAGLCRKQDVDHDSMFQRWLQPVFRYRFVGIRGILQKLP
ncbi:glycoside hydrolase family 98 domain-containing protein [Chryseobacterium sp. SORGH_AS_1175]|uniref:glycoside hydrolase family 98 domain-containing protein n=1 Tax=Chryseobacterium sp. SORGH_AS_1175 TaxID=3041760 RepID=UPI00286A33CD|nr:glycoside hydrolase family 98 domain-containing protein [Chryseobacterium sp. SORGH_AS_1175]